MQARECNFCLPNGLKCRCAATRNQKFCRHHGAQPAPRPKHDVRRANWRDLTTSLPHMEISGLPYVAYVLLEALLHDDDRGVSDRYAGRTLRTLLRRYGSVPATLPHNPGAPVSAPKSAPKSVPNRAAAPAPNQRPFPDDSRPFAENYPELAAFMQQAGIDPGVPQGRR